MVQRYCQGNIKDGIYKTYRMQSPCELPSQSSGPKGTWYGCFGLGGYNVGYRATKAQSFDLGHLLREEVGWERGAE